MFDYFIYKLLKAIVYLFLYDLARLLKIKIANRFINTIV